MKIIPLGTNGFFPSFNRHTACYAIPYGKTLIILDAGSGLFRLQEPEGRELLEKIENVDLFLSHYHFDHTFGFYGAFHLLREKKITVYGMKKKKVFEDVIKKGYFPINYEEKYGNYQWKQLNIGEQAIGNYKIKTRKQYHRGSGSLAFKFEFPDGKKMAYVTDSEPAIEGIEFVRGADILLHEHEIVSGEKDKKMKKLEDFISDGHVTTRGTALIAKEASVGKLVLIHNNPFFSDEELKSATVFARTIFKETYLAKDLEEIEF